MAASRFDPEQVRPFCSAVMQSSTQRSSPCRAELEQAEAAWAQQLAVAD
jgi:hypothetical protein